MFTVTPPCITDSPYERRLLSLSTRIKTASASTALRAWWYRNRIGEQPQKNITVDLLHTTWSNNDNISGKPQSIEIIEHQEDDGRVTRLVLFNDSSAVVMTAPRANGEYDAETHFRVLPFVLGVSANRVGPLYGQCCHRSLANS